MIQRYAREIASILLEKSSCAPRLARFGGRDLQSVMTLLKCFEVDIAMWKMCEEQCCSEDSQNRSNDKLHVHFGSHSTGDIQSARSSTLTCHIQGRRGFITSLRERRARHGRQVRLTIRYHFLRFFCRAVSYSWLQTRRARETSVDLLSLLAFFTRRYS